MANSPAALRGYLDLRAALAGGRLPAPLREQLALLVAEQNGSRYCVSWRTCRAVEAGLPPEELSAARGLEMWLPLWVRLMQRFGRGEFNLKIVR